MDAIIAAVITAAATLCGAAIIYNYKIKKIHDDIKSNSKEVKCFESKSCNNHVKTHELITEKVGEISTALKLQEQDRVNKYENLTEKQKDIKDSINKISDFQKELENVNLENKMFEKTIAQLEATNKLLENEKNGLSVEIEELKKENHKLNMDLAAFRVNDKSDKKELNKPKGRQR